MDGSLRGPRGEVCDYVDKDIEILDEDLKLDHQPAQIKGDRSEYFVACAGV